MKKLLLGNEAVARGLYEAGCTIVSSYPGTPSTEISEYAAEYDELYCEWAPNEKVAVEVAFGASVAGARSFSAMKHVGLNVAADPLFTSSYTGVNGGFVIAVADDPGMHSSQNEQDSRHYAIAAKLPMLEPSDSSECKLYVKYAFELSEEYDTPVLVRLTTRVAHSQSIVEQGERIAYNQKDYKKDMQKYVMMPAAARGRHTVVETRMKRMASMSENSVLNRVEMGDGNVGVITSGIAYQYAREALGDGASYLKLGMINPLPTELIKKFASSVKTLYVIEELDGIIETHCKSIGVKVTGKELFSLEGELNQRIIREKLLGMSPDCVSLNEAVPVRPPVMCPGCPHRGLYYVLNKLGLTVSGDIGCYTLGALPPLNSMDMCLCMGASVSGLHGFNKAREVSSASSVAVIGDSTFMHSGITGLIDIVYNGGSSTVLVLDNSITGMTGHQDNPTTGKTLKGKPAPIIYIEKLCEAIGVPNIRIVDPNDIAETERVIKEETAKNEPSVVIVRRPCVLLKSVKRGLPYEVNEECKGCKACMKIGCPAISMKMGKAKIDKTLCTGCGLCDKLCRFTAIKEVE